MLFHGLQTGEMNKRVVVIEERKIFSLLMKIEIAHFEYIKEVKEGFLVGGSEQVHHITLLNTTLHIQYFMWDKCLLFAGGRKREK